MGSILGMHTDMCYYIYDIRKRLENQDSHLSSNGTSLSLCVVWEGGPGD